MQKQNHISIDYLENPVRFADLINGYIYHGQERIKPTDISELSGAVTRIDDRKKSRRQLRTQVITADVMRRVSDGMQVAVVALENQTDIHYAMPVRVMNLEGSCYHRQWSLRKKAHREAQDLKGAEFLSGFSRKDRLIPVITIVLYFGKEPWNGPVSLKGMMNLEEYSPELRELIADYPIHLLEVRKYEDLEVFHTDLQYVFGFLQNEGSADMLAAYVQEHESVFRNLQEDAYDMISVMAHSEELLSFKQEESVNGGRDMCQAIKDMIENGRSEGRAEGRAEGRRQGALQQLMELVRDNLLSLEDAVSRSGIGREEFLRRLEEV